MKKKILAAGLAAAILAGGIISANAASISELEARQAELEAQQAEYQAQLDERNAAVAEQQSEVDAIVGQVQTVNEEINVSHEKIALLDTEINEKQEDIDAANAEIEENMDVLRQRVKTIYISGDVSSLEIILGAKDFNDFLDKLQLVQYVSNHDSELISQIQDQLDAIAEEKAALEADKDKLVEEKKNLEAKQEELNTLLEENKEVLANLQLSADDAQMQLTLSEEELSNLSAEIQEYYRQQRAAIEAQQAAAAQTSSSDDDDDDDDSSSSNSSSTYVDSSAASSVPATGGWVWPTPGFTYLSSLFEEWRGSANHGALDIAGGGIMGSPVYAAASGTVVSTCSSCTHNWSKYGSCGCGGGYGNYVWINHGDGKETIYGHLTSLTVSTGTYVSAGTLIGYVGSTGYSTGPHLHFEARYNGVRYDPLSEY